MNRISLLISFVKINSDGQQADGPDKKTHVHVPKIGLYVCVCEYECVYGYAGLTVWMCIAMCVYVSVHNCNDNR